MTKQLNTPSDNLLFRPGIIRNKNSSAPVRSLTMSDLNNENVNLTGSFRFDSPGSALKSSQQLNIDFSNFSNHTFFNSAEAKTQKAFSKIINQLPFDGTKSEIDAFSDGLSGFEKYVLDQFPKNTGYLCFSGSSGASGGTYLSVKDFKGSTSYSLAKDPTGESVLDPETNPFTWEFYLSIPSQTNDNQVIAQKISGSNGITIFLSSSATKTNPSQNADVVAIVRSGDQFLTSSLEIEKGKFNHIAAVLDRSSGPGQILMYKNGSKYSSSLYANLDQIDFKTSPLTLGSGTNQTVGSYTFSPKQTLSGALDDFRIWNTSRSQQEIEINRHGNIFSQQNLKLLYRFNEPSGSFSGNGQNLVLDYSGNGLHAQVQNFSMSLRNTSSYGSSPIPYEDDASSVVLFPSFSDVISLNSRLLTSASNYDFNNPNLVTRLIPAHYLLDASNAEGFLTENGGIGNSINSVNDQPGGAQLGQPQIIAGLLYTFSETFDELKMFVDEFKRLLNVDVLSQDTVSNQLLPWLSRYYGIALPNIFSNATIDQYVDGKNVRMDRLGTQSLQTVQNILWRRIFSDLPYIFSTRGTHASLRSILANLGISPSGPIRIREFGGSSVRTLGDSYVRGHEIAAMINMSGTASSAGTLNAQGIDNSRPFLLGSYLSGSRSEPGYPYIAGSLVGGISNNTSDGLFTSGSWSCEGIYKFDNKTSHNTTQSLMRLHVTGTNSASSKHGILFNVVATKPITSTSSTGSLALYGMPLSGSTTSSINLILTGVDVFDGQKWQVSFGRNRNDEISSYVSSSYFLRASKFTPAGLEQFYSTSSYFDDSSNNVLQTINSYNTSGSFLCIGSQSIDTSGGKFLNNSSYSSLTRETRFTGNVSSIRFWSKGLSESESMTHARNFKSLGVDDPETNFNFVLTSSGSFARIRQDVSIDQPVTMSNSSGIISLFDFSQNGLTISGTGFEANKRIVQPERFDYEVLSSNFQSGENPNKVRIRSFLDADTASTFGTSVAPLHDIPQNEDPTDDRRVSIEVSVVQALNEDIMNIFSTLDSLDNLIGSPELVFAQEYTHLRNLRRIYFNRLTSKINFQSFFEFFKWFDDTISMLLEQMLPWNSKFMGGAYVIESHALERPKFTYKYYDMYLGEENRGGKEVIQLQQFIGTLRKF